MRPRIAAFGALGTAITLLAAVAVFAPGVVESAGPLAALATALDGVDRRQLLLLASAVVGLFLTAVTWRAARSVRDERDAFDEATADPPEAVTSARQRLTASGLERDFDAAIRGDDDAAERVRERLAETAAHAAARRSGRELTAARTAVRNGTWTDDRTAAATLADGDGPTYSIASRLRLWLDPESERERRLDRTVRAITAVAGDELGGSARDAAVTASDGDHTAFAPAAGDAAPARDDGGAR